MSLRTAGVTLTIVAVGALAAACQRPLGLSDADETAIRASVDSFAAQALRRDWDGNVALFHAQGTMMPPNQPAVTGHDAILAWMKAYPPITAFETGVDEVAGGGVYAYVQGHYAVMVMPPGATAAIADTGKFLTIHVRVADGSWPIMFDMFNSNKPAM